jgi:alpha-amylase
MRTLLCLALVCGCMDLGNEGKNPRPQSLVQDWRDEVIYQIVTDRFADGDVNNDFNVDITGTDLTRYQGGDFLGIIDHLDYLQTLGVTTLWISPIVRNVESDANLSGYHGYWTQDFLHLNPHFGDLATLRHLVAECHRRNMKVVLDIVVNHMGQLFFYDINLDGVPDEVTIGTGDGTPLGRPGGSPVGHVLEVDPDYDPRGVQAATSLGESGMAPIHFFHIANINRMPPAPAMFANPDWFHRKGRITNWNDPQQVVLGDFPGGLKDLATERAEVRAALAQVYSYWIDAADFDGFRIDTVKHVEPEFFEDFSARIRQHNMERGKQNFILFGEIFAAPDDQMALYTQNSRLDSVEDFQFKYQVVDDTIKNSGPTKKAEQLLASRAALYPSQPAAGGITLSPQQAFVRFLDNHDTARFMYDKPSVAALKNALAFLLTMDGIPCIYYGTEQALSGGNDPANRERFFPGGFDTNSETFKYTQSLLALRKQLAPLRRGDLTVVWSTDHAANEEDAGIFAFERAAGSDRVLVVLNVSDMQTSHTASGGSVMHTSFAPGTLLHAKFPEGASDVTVDSTGGAVIQVPARGVLVLAP